MIHSCLNCYFRYPHSACIEPVPRLHCLPLSEDGSTSWARTLWGIHSSRLPLSHDPLFILFTDIFLDLMLFALLQINYRDFLQSPLQVITVSLILKFWSPERNYSFSWSYGTYGSPFFLLYNECNIQFLITCLFIYLFWQPLMDNLEAQTYETFEKDTVKYTQVCVIYLASVYL